MMVVISISCHTGRFKPWWLGPVAPAHQGDIMSLCSNFASEMFSELVPQQIIGHLKEFGTWTPRIRV